MPVPFFRGMQERNKCTANEDALLPPDGATLGMTIISVFI